MTTHKLIITSISVLISINSWSACTYDLDITQTSLNTKQPGTLIFPNRIGQKNYFDISSTYELNNQFAIKTYIAANNNSFNNNFNGSKAVPQNGIFAFEYKIKTPIIQMVNGEQITIFPASGIGINNESKVHIANLSYLNSSTSAAQSVKNEFMIANSDLQPLLSIPITSTSDGYQYIGIYYNQNSKQVGYLVNGVNKGYLDNYLQPIQQYDFTFAIAITGFSPTSSNIGKEVSIELITDATKMTQTFPSGSKDICGNLI